MRVLRTLCRVSLSPDSCVSQTETIFARFGPASMIFAKFIPGFASVATAMAGAVRLRYWKFSRSTCVGALLWVGLALVLGRIFRDAIVDVLETLTSLGKYGLALVASRSWPTCCRNGGGGGSSSHSCGWIASPSTSCGKDDRRRARRHDPRRALGADAGRKRPHSRGAPLDMKKIEAGIEGVARTARSSSTAHARTRRARSASRRSCASWDSSACGRSTAASTRGSPRASTSSASAQPCMVE